ncbi:MAG: UbiA family prenyltransferase [Verrucomicrobiota bacterium]
MIRVSYSIFNNKSVMLKNALFWLKVSRPGLWFATIWLYLLPTSQMNIWQSIPFWFGFIYCCFPLNFLIYGWNDIVDFEIDTKNPRKDNFLFGARGSKEQLAHLWKPIVISQLITYPLAIFWGGWKMLLILITLIFLNAIYNWPSRGLRSRPPWELLCQVGYVLVVPFSIWINNTAALPWATYAYLLLFAFQSHLIGEIMDLESDRDSGRITIATQMGMKFTKLLIIVIVSLEVALLFIIFKDYLFGSMLASGLIWLLLDLFFIFKTKTYTLIQLKLFGLMSNALAVASIVYVWYSGCLHTIPD